MTFAKSFGVLMFCVGSIAQATTTLAGFTDQFAQVRVLGPSNIEISTGRTSTPCAEAKGTTCDSCATLAQTAIEGSSLSLPNGLACNNRQVEPSLLFSVTIRSDQTSSYDNTCLDPVLGTVEGREVVPFSVSPFTPNMANQDVTATWRWSDLCAAMGAGTNCAASFIKVFRVGFNKDCAGREWAERGASFLIRFRYVGQSAAQTFGCGPTAGSFEGFCNFMVSPLDRGAQLTQVQASTANAWLTGDQTGNLVAQPTSSDVSRVRYSALRVFYGQDSVFSKLTPASTHVDLPIAADGSGVASNVITGLENEKQYVFLTANVDEGGNVFGFSDPWSPQNAASMSSSVDPFGQTQAIIPGSTPPASLRK